MEVKLSEQAPEGWNDFLLKSPAGNVHQTVEYANYLHEHGLRKTHYAVAESGDERRGELLFFESSALAGAPAKLKPLIRLVEPHFHVLNWTCGPVALDGHAYEAIVSFVASYAKKHRLPLKAAPHPLFDSGAFLQNGFVAEQKATFVIDLTLGKDVLWGKVDKAAKKLVNRTLEQVEVRELADPEEFTQYVDVINDGRKRAGIPPYSSSDILGVSQYLHPKGYYTVFGAFEGSRLLAGLGVSYFNGYLHEWGAGTSSEAIQRKIYASDAIKWHIIEWASLKGHRFFDLSGVSPKPFDQQTKKEQGIFRFKAKWGGDLVKYREYSLPISRKRDKLLRLAKKLVSKD